MRRFTLRSLVLALALTLLQTQIAQASDELLDDPLLTLEKAMLLAIRNDPWRQKSAFQEKAALANSVAMSSMPDPIVSIGIANLPSDGFDFNQEPMTQLKAGVSQMFPRGDTLKLQRLQQQQISQQQPYLRQHRQANVAVSAANLWLDAYRAKASMQLIENDRALFEQLSQIVQTNYASGLGNTRQQDLLRADLEIVRIEDKLLDLSTQQAQALAKLSEWIAYSSNGIGSYANTFADVSQQSLSESLPKAMPQVQINDIVTLVGHNVETNGPSSHLRLEEVALLVTQGSQQQLAQRLLSHPLIQSIDQKIAAGQSAIELAQQQYKPQWQLSASYAYRDDEPNGRSRADFLSVGVSFDLPLFTENRQDKSVLSAVNSAEAIRMEKHLALRTMMSNLRAVYANYQRLLQRQHLYQSRILTQTKQQSEATLSAYTNDEGDFAEVVRSRIGLLNAQLDALNIDVDLLKTKVHMAYFFVQAQVNQVQHSEISRSLEQQAKQEIGYELTQEAR